MKIAAVLLFGLSAVLGTWSNKRLTAANPTTRLPKFGMPPHQPSGHRILRFVALSSMGFAEVLLIDDGESLLALLGLLIVLVSRVVSDCTVRFWDNGVCLLLPRYRCV